MLIWPWVLFGAIWQHGGLQMNPNVAKVIAANPQATNFFVTLLANLICIIIDALFSFAVIRFAQKWIVHKKNERETITVFHISLFSAFRLRIFPWGPSDLRSLFIRTRWLLAFLVVLCIGAFTFILPATTSLISPLPFTKNATLNGTELDFASNATDCVDWFNANKINDSAPCDWNVFECHLFILT